MRSGALTSLALLTGCQVVFPRDADSTGPSVTIVQQRAASRPERGDGSVQVNVRLTPTAPAHPLIMVAIIRSESEGVEKIIDNGESTWQRAVNGNAYNDVSQQPFRVEVWFALESVQAEFFDVYCTKDRPMGVVIAELDLPTTSLSALASSTRGDEISAIADSGTIDLAQPALVVATTGFNVVSSGQLLTEGYDALQPIAPEPPDVHAVTAIGIADPGTVGVQWSLEDNPGAHWNAAIAGLSF